MVTVTIYEMAAPLERLRSARSPYGSGSEWVKVTVTIYELAPDCVGVCAP